MASRLLANSGGDHPTLDDWEAWVTNPSNFGTAGNWDDPVNGGHQIVRVADQALAFAAPQILDVDALVTATNYKVTIRPDFEGGATAAGAKVAADGAFDLSAVLKNPRLSHTDYSHNATIDLSASPNVEWHFEDLTISPAYHRSHCFRLSQVLTRSVFIDRCILADRAGGGRSLFYSVSTANGAQVYVRSSLIHQSEMGGGECLGEYYVGQIVFLGCTILIPNSGGNLFNGHVLDFFGCAIFTWTDGYTGINLSAQNPNYCTTKYNVTNLNGSSWNTDFGSGNGNVNNSTIAAMFVSSSNHYPKSGGPLADAVTWSGLPSGIQALWPDTDFLGQTITKSGTLSAGAIRLASAPASATITAAINDGTDTTSGTAAVAVTASAALSGGTDTVASATGVSIAATATLAASSDGMASTAAVAVSGSAALAATNDGVSANAAVLVGATSSLTDASDAMSAAGAVGITASAALVDATDVTSSTSGGGVTASVALSDAQDQTAAAVSVRIAANAALADAADAMAGAGAVAVSVSATLSGTNDAVASAAGVAITASGALSDTADVVTATVGALGSVTATAALADAADSVQGAAGVGIIASATLIGTVDGLSAATQVRIDAAAALADATDGVTGTIFSVNGAAAALVDATDAIASTVGLAAGASAVLQDGADQVSAAAGIEIIGLSYLIDSVDQIVARIQAARDRVSSDPSRRVMSVDAGPLGPALGSSIGPTGDPALSNGARRVDILEEVRRAVSEEAPRRVVVPL